MPKIYRTMRSKFLLFTLLMPVFLQAQQETSFGLEFNHLALSVKNVDVSAAFYKDVLQLEEITNRTKMEGIRWFSMGPHAELHLISIIKEDFLTNKAIHVALSTNNFDAIVNRLNKLKIPYSDWPGMPNKVNVRADGIKQIFFKDPDGYWIEVNSVGVH